MLIGRFFCFLFVFFYFPCFYLSSIVCSGRMVAFTLAFAPCFAQPSIIFFDEIDGLAPVRSVKQDQIHASVVSTLLALMDGLDSRGQVKEEKIDAEKAHSCGSHGPATSVSRIVSSEGSPPLSDSLL